VTNLSQLNTIYSSTAPYSAASNILNYPTTIEGALGEHNTDSIHSFFKTIDIDTKI